MPKNIFKKTNLNLSKITAQVPLASSEIPFKNILTVGFALNLLIIGLVFLARKNFLPPEVPLFYGLPEGEPQLVPSLYLILPNLSALSIISFNILVSALIKDDFLKKTLNSVSLIATFFGLITTWKIFFLISSF